MASISTLAPYKKSRRVYRLSDFIKMIIIFPAEALENKPFISESFLNLWLEVGYYLVPTFTPNKFPVPIHRLLIFEKTCPLFFSTDVHYLPCGRAKMLIPVTVADPYAASQQQHFDNIVAS